MRQSNKPVSCHDCPLQRCDGLQSPEPHQLEFLDTFKEGELLADKGDMVLEQGASSPHLHTVLDGILIRYRKLDDGRRQIVNFMFPGDLVGLQAAFDNENGHAVEAVLPSRLCIFPRGRFTELLGEHPRLGYDLIWLAAKEETSLEEHLVALGQRNAKERVAYLAVWLLDRALHTGLADESNRIAIPIRQSQIADMLGLSLVHTNRTIKSLSRDGVVEWKPGEICVPDMEKAAEFAQYERSPHSSRPYI